MKLPSRTMGVRLVYSRCLALALQGLVTAILPKG